MLCCGATLTSFASVATTVSGMSHGGGTSAPSALTATGKVAVGTPGSSGVKVTLPNCQTPGGSSVLVAVTPIVWLPPPSRPGASVKLAGLTESVKPLALVDAVQVTA